MRMLMHVKLPLEPFNTLVRRGTIGATMQKLLEAMKAEAVYFTEVDGRRGAILVVDLPEPSKIPALAEPWFLALNAEVHFHPVMSPADLAKAGLDALGKTWA